MLPEWDQRGIEWFQSIIYLYYNIKTLHTGDNKNGTELKCEVKLKLLIGAKNLVAQSNRVEFCEPEKECKDSL